MNTNTVNPEALLRTDPPFGTGSRRTARRGPSRTAWWPESPRAWPAISAWT